MDPSFSPVTVSKTEQVARMLLNRIIETGVKPGSALATEAELLEQMDVSRPTLREGLRILESQGVLKLRPGPRGGIIVAKPSVDVIAQSVSVYLRLNEVPFVEILKSRIAIEPALARDAAQNGTEEHFAVMEATILAMEAPDCSDQTVYLENRKFHGEIAKASANPVLELFWVTISIMASGESANIRYSSRNRSHIIRAHRRILAALRARDSEEAATATMDHLGELKELLQSRYGDRLTAPTQIAFKGGSRSG